MAYKDKEAQRANGRKHYHRMKHTEQYKERMQKTRVARILGLKAYSKTPAGRASLRKSADKIRRRRMQPVMVPRHLYIMRFREFPDTFKVGRTDDIESRQCSMGKGLFLTVEVVERYENFGHIEPLVHSYLQQYRVTTGAGREWYRCPLEHVKSTINYAISNTAASSSEAPVQYVSEGLDHPEESDEEDA